MRSVWNRLFENYVAGTFESDRLAPEAELRRARWSLAGSGLFLISFGLIQTVSSLIGPQTRVGLMRTSTSAPLPTSTIPLLLFLSALGVGLVVSGIALRRRWGWNLARVSLLCNIVVGIVVPAWYLLGMENVETYRPPVLILIGFAYLIWMGNIALIGWLLFRWLKRLRPEYPPR